MSREAIAKALKRLREQSGLTADQVGVMVGKSGKTVNAWENNRGQPDAEILMKLCDIYNVGDILSEFRDKASEPPFALSNKEKTVVLAYRAHPDMQNAVDRLLGCADDSETGNHNDTVLVYMAARSKNGEYESAGYRSISKDLLEKLQNAPKVKDGEI